METRTVQPVNAKQSEVATGSAAEYLRRAEGVQAGVPHATGDRELVLVGPLPPPLYGQSVSFKMLVHGIVERGIPASVIDLAHGKDSEQHIGMFTFSRVRDYSSILRRFTVVVRSGRKRVYLTIAQSRHGFFRDLVIIWIARILGHEVVGHLKGGNYDNFYAGQPRWLRTIIRHTLLQTRSILILGEGLRSMFDFEPRLASRIHVVPNGLPDGEARHTGKHLPALGARDPIRLLYLSNLIESKGYFDVLRAVRLLRDRLGEGSVHCDFHGDFRSNQDDWVITSAADARARFEEYVRKHRLEGVVAYRGVAAGEVKREALRAAHFFLLPTRYRNEGQPVSIIEAMAEANVVVSTDYRAIPDLVVDGETGRLIPYGAPWTIAAAIEEIVSDPARYAAMSQAALDRFKRFFTREAHLHRILPHLLGTAPSSDPGLFQ